MELFRNKNKLWEQFYRSMEKQEGKESRAATLTLNPCVLETMVVDGLYAGGQNRLYSMTADIGGLGIEVSRILSGCGYKTMCAGFEYSTDKKTLEQFMQALRIPFSFAQAKGKMRSVIRILDQGGGAPTELKESSWKVTDEALSQLERTREKVLKGLGQGDLLVVGGSVPDGVPKNIYRTWISEARREGLRTVLCAEGDLLGEGIAALPYAAVMGQADLAGYMGRELSGGEETADAAAKLARHGISLVCVFDEQYHVTIVRNNEVSSGGLPVFPRSGSTGGRASVAAGICMAIIQEKEEEALQYVLAVLEGTLRKPGNAMCTEADFEEYFLKK